MDAKNCKHYKTYYEKSSTNFIWFQIGMKKIHVKAGGGFFGHPIQLPIFTILRLLYIQYLINPKLPPMEPKILNLWMLLVIPHSETN